MEKKRLQTIKNFENQIAKMQHDKDNPPEVEDLDVIVDEIVGYSHRTNSNYVADT